MLPLAAALALSLWPASVAAAGPTGEAGGSVAAGSAGYWRVASFGEAEWKRTSLSPYVWGSLSTDRYQSSRLELGGGAWRSFPSGWRAKGGLSWAHGRYRRTKDGSSAVTFEAGAERDVGTGVAGGEFLYTTGALAPPSAVRASQREASRDVLATFYEERLSGYARWPLGAGVAGASAALDLASHAPDQWSQMLSWRRPLAASLWLTPAVTVYEDGGTDFILSLALGRAFG